MNTVKPMTRMYFGIPLPLAYAKGQSDRGFLPECISTKAGLCVYQICRDGERLIEASGAGSTPAPSQYFQTLLGE